jgi:hypothetical protein
MDVFHQPVKNVNVTVHTNVDVVQGLVVVDEFVKVLHVLDN